MVRKTPKQRGGESQEEANTMLMNAVVHSDLDKVKYAIELGADVNINMKSSGGNPLVNAIFFGETENDNKIAKELIKAGADVNIKDAVYGITPLMATHSNNGNDKLDLLKLLIQSGADVNAQPYSGVTALIYISDRSHTPEMIEELLKAGANINHQDAYGTTALFKASNHYSSFNKIAIVLIKAGANVNIQDNNGNTPILLASMANKYELVKELINAGADFSIHYASKGNKTIIELAKEGKFNKQITNLILNYKPIINRTRNVSALKETLGENTRLPENVLSSISGYLSGKPGTLNTQLQSLKTNVNKFKGGRQVKHTRKLKRGSKRTKYTRRR
jgi:ankyrin repeat protein